MSKALDTPPLVDPLRKSVLSCDNTDARTRMVQKSRSTDRPQPGQLFCMVGVLAAAYSSSIPLKKQICPVATSIPKDSIGTITDPSPAVCACAACALAEFHHVEHGCSYIFEPLCTYHFSPLSRALCTTCLHAARFSYVSHINIPNESRIYSVSVCQSHKYPKRIRIPSSLIKS